MKTCHYKYCNNPLPFGRRKFCSDRCGINEYSKTPPRPKRLVCANPDCGNMFSPRSVIHKCCGDEMCYRAINKDKINKYHKEHYQKDLDQNRAKRKQYARQNKNYHRECQRTRRERERAVAPLRSSNIIREILRAPAPKSARLINALIAEAHRG